MISLAHKRRNDLIVELMKRKTKEITSTPETARNWLISLGVYNEDGSLTPEFGGQGRNEIKCEGAACGTCVD